MSSYQMVYFGGLTPAPKAIIDLKVGKLYAPNLPCPPFVAYLARQEATHMIGIYAIRDDGTDCCLCFAPPKQAWIELAYHLGLASA